MELSKEQRRDTAETITRYLTRAEGLTETIDKLAEILAPTPAPAREPDGDVVQEALRTFHSVPWGHRLASDELGDLGDRKWRDGMAAVVGMLQAKHDAEFAVYKHILDNIADAIGHSRASARRIDGAVLRFVDNSKAELQSLREQHQKDMEIALGPVTYEERREFERGGEGPMVQEFYTRTDIDCILSRRALIAKDEPKEIEVPEGMLKAFVKQENHRGEKWDDGVLLKMLKAALRWQRDNQPESTQQRGKP